MANGSNLLAARLRSAGPAISAALLTAEAVIVSVSEASDASANAGTSPIGEAAGASATDGGEVSARKPLTAYEQGYCDPGEGWT